MWSDYRPGRHENAWNESLQFSRELDSASVRSSVRSSAVCERSETADIELVRRRSLVRDYGIHTINIYSNKVDHSNMDMKATPKSESFFIQQCSSIGHCNTITFFFIYLL